MDETIKLEIKREAFDFVDRTIAQHKTLIHMLKVSDPIKKTMLTDMSKIESTLHNAQRG